MLVLAAALELFGRFLIWFSVGYVVGRALLGVAQWLFA